MLKDCPHCATRVIPNRDGTCPACRGDTAKEAERVRLDISSEDSLPSCCIVCGSPSARRVRIARRKTGGDYAGSEMARGVALVSGPLFLVGILFAWLTRDGVMVRVPLCAGCEEPDPTWVDWGRRTMTFVVPLAFKDLVLEARRSARSDRV